MTIRIKGKEAGATCAEIIDHSTKPKTTVAGPYSLTGDPSRLDHIKGFIDDYDKANPTHDIQVIWSKGKGKTVEMNPFSDPVAIAQGNLILRIGR